MTETNHLAVIGIALVVGVTLYGGITGIEAVLTGDSPTPEITGTVEARGTTYHLDQVGRPTVVGEVSNGLGDPVTNVSVTVTFYRDGDQVAEVTREPLREAVPAGGTAPFDVHLPEEESVDDYDVEVSYDEGGSVADPFEVTDTEVLHEGSNRVEIAGTVRNAGDGAVDSPRVVATFYDVNGSVVGVRTVQPSRTVEPGESLTVRVNFRTLGNVPSRAGEFGRVELLAVADG